MLQFQAGTGCYHPPPTPPHIPTTPSITYCSICFCFWTFQ
jgi:hypothetical protein